MHIFWFFPLHFLLILLTSFGVVGLILLDIYILYVALVLGFPLLPYLVIWFYSLWLLESGSQGHRNGLLWLVKTDTTLLASLFWCSIWCLWSLCCILLGCWSRLLSTILLVFGTYCSYLLLVLVGLRNCFRKFISFSAEYYGL